MIQGDHGPVAFRAISYRFFNPGTVQTDNKTLRYFEGEFNHQMPDLSTLNKISETEVDEITSRGGYI